MNHLRKRKFVTHAFLGWSICPSSFVDNLNLVFYHAISSIFHIWITVIKLSPMFEMGLRNEQLSRWLHKWLSHFGLFLWTLSHLSPNFFKTSYIFSFYQYLNKQRSNMGFVRRMLTKMATKMTATKLTLKKILIQEYHQNVKKCAIDFT